MPDANETTKRGVRAAAKQLRALEPARSAPAMTNRSARYKRKDARMTRFARVLLVAGVALCLLAPTASAAPTNLGNTLGNLWTTILETPTPDNPFGSGPRQQCFTLAGNIVAPFSVDGGTFTCPTVAAGTRIFVAAHSNECSTFAGDCGGPGSNEAHLRAAAETQDAGITAAVTLNGQPVSLSTVESGLLTIHLPQDNVFGLQGAERNGLSVAHGFVYLTAPLSPGTYVIQGHVMSPNPPLTSDFTTTIVVR